MRSLSLFGIGFGAAAAVLAVNAAIGQGSSSPFRGHNSNAPLAWSADRIEIQDAIGRVMLTGGVVAKQDALTMSAGRVTIAYNKGGSGVSVERLDAAGGVSFTRGSDVARGDFAVYDLQKKLITLVGNVSLRQSRGDVRGGRLVIDLNTNRGTLGGSGSAPSPSTSANPDAPQPSGGRVSGTFEVSKGN
jgi:lipopolysaccharide export system protein LptA